MNPRKLSAILCSFALFATVSVTAVVAGNSASAQPAAAAAAPARTAGGTLAAAAAGATQDDVYAAMKRDLSLSKKQAKKRIKFEAKAIKVEKKLRKKLGGKFSSLWITKKGTIAATVTSKKAAKKAKKLGVQKVKIVATTVKKLEKKATKLRKTPRSISSKVTSWWVDPVTNKIVIQAKSKAAANSAAKSAGLKAGQFAVEVSQDSIVPVRDYWGGDPLSGCTLAFAVEGGFVTAGHCAVEGPGHVLKTELNGTQIGTVVAQQFGGGIDAAYARNENGWTGRGKVTHWNGGGAVDINGSSEAPIGSHLCKAGRTTKWTCGYVLKKNVTLNYNNGANPVVATETSACALGGDSGGAYVWNDQAQGITSGSNLDMNNCRSWFQPINTILQKWNLKLLVGGGTSSGTQVASIQGWQNKCIDVPNSEFVNGKKVQIWDCNGTNAQRIEFRSDGSLRVGGKCLDAEGWGTGNGTKVQLWDCTGGANQQWTLNSAKDLVNKHANKCVDVQDWGKNNGAKLQLWQCSGTANQKWWKK
ncbi:S1 family peptidase [Rarobacter incanus]|uniref:Streptogrisin C n=1 Tax=Rarobacter incanus TaxID=153494 RepID=A0A542SP87_9MICO|nr:S1 family peptidase [Rarobacter incanus]TQK76402.1 streptogrisin C [Rarobacter incanus]